jgi:hypothetical protein
MSELDLTFINRALVKIQAEMRTAAVALRRPKSSVGCKLMSGCLTATPTGNAAGE